MDTQERNRSSEPTVELINPIDLPNPKRREFLAAMGGMGMVLVAGCLGDDDEDTYLITFTDQDIEVEVATDEFILFQALDEGVEFPDNLCEIGRCGRCTIKYDGDANDVVDHTEDQQALEADQVTDGWILTCVANANANFDAVVTRPGD